MMNVSATSINGPPCGGEGGFLSAGVRIPLDDQFVGGGLQPVERGLGEQWVGELAELLNWDWHTFPGADRACYHEKGAPVGGR